MSDYVVPEKNLDCIRKAAIQLHSVVTEEPASCLTKSNIYKLGMPEWVILKLNEAGFEMYGDFIDNWFMKGSTFVKQMMGCTHDEADAIFWHFDAFADAYWSLVMSIPKQEVPEWAKDSLPEVVKTSKYWLIYYKLKLKFDPSKIPSLNPVLFSWQEHNDVTALDPGEWLMYKRKTASLWDVVLVSAVEIPEQSYKELVEVFNRKGGSDV